MYRDYENPRELEKQLAEAKANRDSVLESLKELGNSTGGVDERTGYTAYDALQDELEHWEQEVSELEQRTNFAWQDEQYG